jgi:hypothetical protein
MKQGILADSHIPLPDTYYLSRSMFMKCSKCGFVSFDDLIECKKCGARLKEKKSPEITGVQQPVPQFEPASDDAARLPPQWHETIQTIKRELEAIEGGAVDKQSRAAAATVTGSASAAQLL